VDEGLLKAAALLLAEAVPALVLIVHPDSLSQTA
jgi:hypothetical protein